MTRKNMKGIVGKNAPTPARHGKGVGAGISFTDENLTNSAEIERAIKDRKNQ